MTHAIIVFSIVLQFITAGLALNLIRTTGKMWAWVFIAVALLLMGIRRSMSLVHSFLSADFTIDPITESVALLISCLMFFGVLMVREIFSNLNKSRINAQNQLDQRNLAEKSLRESEERFCSLFDNSPDAVFLTIPDGTITAANPSACAMFGWSEQEFTQFDRSVLLDMDDPRLAEALQERQQTGQVKGAEVTAITKAGSKFSVEVDSVILPGEPLRSFVIMRDIAERKQAEQALRDSETKQRAMVENILDVITLIDKDGIIRFTSPNIEKWFGWRPEERIGDSPWENIHPDDRDDARKVFADLMEKPGLSATTECRYRRKDGGYEWIEFSGINRLQDPNIAGILMNYHIITERKRSEETLKESEERFRLLVENAPDAIFARNKRGCFTYLNKAAIALFGATSAQELIGTPIIESYHPKVRETLLRRMQFINEQQLAAPLLQSICLQLNGNEVNVETVAVPMHYMGEDGALVFMRDITDRIEQQKRQQSLEKQLFQSQKLESVGTLAGGIAHDFNNVLTGLYGNLGLVKMKIANDHPGFRFLEAAEQAMSRTTALTNRLLTFSKGGDPVTESLDLVSLIEEIVNFCLSGSNVKPVIVSAANLWLVRVDQRQIQQGLANLLANAGEAMPSGGLLTITMENAELAENTVHGLPVGRYLRITMTDEGPGIDPDLLDRIFDPYFTTKEMGSGLGLATAYSIIDKHGGQINVASQLGKGTTFTIYLPAIEVAEETPLTQPGVAQGPLTQEAKILVMDDEEMIRNTLNEMLRELGFAVETAVEGQQAIDMYRQAIDTGKPFAIVILDLTIPGGMGGQEAAKGILQIDPEAKIIVSSGYADDPVMANYADYGFKGVATKPYSMNKLSGVLAKVMEKG